MKGFTLIEIMIVLGIIAVLGAVSMTSFSGTARKQSLNKEAAIVLSLISEARNKTITSVNNSEFGVHFDSGSATMFEGTAYSSSDPSNVVRNLSGGVSISSISLTGGSSNLSFERLTGEPSVTGTLTLSSSDGSNTRTITINPTGLPELL